MRNLKFIIFLFTELMFAGCDLISNFMPKEKPDSYYFNKAESLEWKESYVIAATWYPAQIQVWDSETNKMVHKYSLCENEKKWLNGNKRSIYVYNMTQHNGVIWFVGCGLQQSLVRLECRTGKFEYINLDIKPYEVTFLPNYNNGKGAVLAASLADPRSGIALRILDLDGKVIEKHDIPLYRTDINSVTEYFYENGNYYVLANSDDNDLNRNRNDILKVVKINDETRQYVYDVSTDKFYGDFISKAFGREPDKFHCGVLINSNGNQKFMVLSIRNHDFKDENTRDGKEYIRFLYRINSFENFDVEYTGIKYDEDDAKTFWSVDEYENNVYITGKQLHIIPKKENIHGLEATVYSAAGGEPQKLAQMPLANQVYCEMKDDCAWFSKDIYSQDNITYEWDLSDKTGIYKLDYKNQKVYEFSADGTARVCEWTECR